MAMQRGPILPEAQAESSRVETASEMGLEGTGVKRVKVWRAWVVTGQADRLFQACWGEKAKEQQQRFLT